MISTDQSKVREIEWLPDLLVLHEHNPARYPHLLESVAHGTSQARWDILFAFPGETLSSDSCPGGDFLSALDGLWQQECSDVSEEGDIPFSGGWFLYLSYELAAQIESVLTPLPVPDGLPVALATRFPAAVLRDHQTSRCFLVQEAAYESLIESMEADCVAVKKTPTADLMPVSCGDFRESAGASYIEALGRIHDYIVEGDVFQVNLSRLWHVMLGSDVPHSLVYRHLRKSNPAPFAVLATWGDKAIVSSSPERLVEVRGDQVQTRPIAGTRPRAVDKADDQVLKKELEAHPKERAEHIMLIDLERNDLGRVAQAGSVEVNELMVIESYAHVHHIVSNVRARLRPDVTPGEVIKAVFPGGTITGCPKIRCMEIIAELEDEGRGAYTGSVGYLNRNGDMDLNILIRTMVRDGDRLRWRAGAGIVVDSDPVKELAETRSKARGLLLALKN